MSDPNRPSPALSFVHRNDGLVLDRWADSDAFAAHVAAVQEECRATCAKGAGECSLSLTLGKYSNEGKVTNVTVSGACEAEDCPDPKETFDALYQVMGYNDTEPLRS